MTRDLIALDVIETSLQQANQEVDDGIWNVWFGPLLLGRFDERELKIYGVRGLQ